MNKITPQDVFDAAWKAFVVEGKPPAVNRDDDFFACAYLTEDGRKCAIGLVLPDGHPAQRFVGSAGGLFLKYPKLLGGGDVICRDDIYAIDALQGPLHDHLINKNTGSWQEGVNLREEYLQVAKKFNLTVPE